MNNVNRPYSNLQFTDLQIGLVSFQDSSTLRYFRNEAKPFLTI